MTPGIETPGRRMPPAAKLWRSLFKPHRVSPPPYEPLRCSVPQVCGAEIASVYYDHRVGGDFYEFLRVGPSRVLFALLDMAGGRAEVRAPLIAAQSIFRSLAPELFAEQDVNETTAMMRLSTEMNLTILQTGLRNCPAFVGCYNEEVGTICYASAGHTPALLRDLAGIGRLDATGLPLGLFSHVTQSASTCLMAPGGALLVVSRGIVEAEYAGEEFGLERVADAFERAAAQSAHGVCLDILQAVRDFTRRPPTHNDVTALVLVRHDVRHHPDGDPG